MSVNVNTNMAKVKVVNKKNGKKINLYVGKSRQFTPLVKKLVKEDINNIDIPRGVVFDKIKKVLYPIFTKNGKKIQNKVATIINSNPQRLKLSANDILNLDTNRIVNRKKVLTKTNQLTKNFKQYEIKNNLIYQKKNQVLLDASPAPSDLYV